MFVPTRILTPVAVLAAILGCHVDRVDAQTQTQADEELQGSEPTVVQSLFRFPASKLGPEFEELLKIWYHDWLHLPPGKDGVPAPMSPEEKGLEHAFHSVSTPAATLFRRQCYGPAPLNSTYLNNLYNNLEQRKKEIDFEYKKDKAEELRLVHTMTNRFHPAFMPQTDVVGGVQGSAAIHMHIKKAGSTVDTVYAKTTMPQNLDSPSSQAYFTSSADDDTQRWAWRPPAHYSSRGTADILEFKLRLNDALRTKLEPKLKQTYQSDFRFEYARSSGMFWYTPGSVREWHNNRLDLVGHKRGIKGTQEILSSQVWRMYFIRTVRGADFDSKLRDLRKREVDPGANDHSAMHIIPGGEGITEEVLKNAGARRLTDGERRRQWSDEFAEPFSQPAADFTTTESSLNRTVWRLPDQDGYVTLFRLPDIWHCVVSEEVHRYSLGFAFSDREVQALLSLAGIDFDTKSRDTGVEKSSNQKDEL